MLHAYKRPNPDTLLLVTFAALANRRYEFMKRSIFFCYHHLLLLMLVTSSVVDMANIYQLKIDCDTHRYCAVYHSCDSLQY